VFPSPADVLEPSIQFGRVLHVGSGHRRQVVLHAANNDHTFETRIAVAQHLDAMGIGAVILEHAFYGTPRRHAGPQTVRTVVDFIEMGIAAVYEGIGLVLWLVETGSVTGVAGFSQGGSNAAVVGALSPVPIAVAPMAASHSSSPVFSDGILADGVDWDALGGASGRALLRERLANLSVLNLPTPPHTATAVFGIASRDGYVLEANITPIVER
jgi:hypothetical protein